MRYSPVQRLYLEYREVRWGEERWKMLESGSSDQMEMNFECHTSKLGLDPVGLTTAVKPE